MLRQLNLPPAGLDLSRAGEKIFVRCLVRKKKLVLTPEEWVRQHILYALIHHFEISPVRIGVEVGLSYNGRKKRADIVIYSGSAEIELVIECKAPDVNLTNETLFQIAQYNAIFDAKKLLISNGIDHFSVITKPELIIQPGFMVFHQ